MPCNHVWKDLSQGIGPVRHYYCKKCKAHNFREKLYSADEWEAWVNDEQSQLDLFKEASNA